MTDAILENKAILTRPERTNSWMETYSKGLDKTWLETEKIILQRNSEMGTLIDNSNKVIESSLELKQRDRQNAINKFQSYGAALVYTEQEMKFLLSRRNAEYVEFYSTVCANCEKSYELAKEKHLKAAADQKEYLLNSREERGLARRAPLDEKSIENLTNFEVERTRNKVMANALHIERDRRWNDWQMARSKLSQALENAKDCKECVIPVVL